MSKTRRMRCWPTIGVAFLSLIWTAIGASAATERTVRLEFSTVGTGGKYSPRHVLAVWVVDANTNYIKTICKFGAKRQKYLAAWKLARGENASVDGVTGATRKEHTALTVTWDCLDAAKKRVPDGTYLLFVEMADSHDGSPLAAFPVVLGSKRQEKVFPDTKALTHVKMTYEPVLASSASPNPERSASQ